jgi:hypothetical protein
LKIEDVSVSAKIPQPSVITFRSGDVNAKRDGNAAGATDRKEIRQCPNACGERGRWLTALMLTLGSRRRQRRGSADHQAR